MPMGLAQGIHVALSKLGGEIRPDLLDSCNEVVGAGDGMGIAPLRVLSNPIDHFPIGNPLDRCHQLIVAILAAGSGLQPCHKLSDRAIYDDGIVNVVEGAGI